MTPVAVRTKHTTVSGLLMNKELSFRYNPSSVGTKQTQLSGPLTKMKLLFHYTPSCCWNNAHQGEWTFREKEVVILF